eukprot:1146935-Pelagomonas_calceolata.AAC.3
MQRKCAMCSFQTGGSTARTLTSALKGYKGYKGKRPQSRCLTAGLFINTHEVMKKKRKFVVILGERTIDGKSAVNCCLLWDQGLSKCARPSYADNRCDVQQESVLELRLMPAWRTSLRSRKKGKQKKNYVGRETLPTSIKEKGTHWLRRAVIPFNIGFKTEKDNVDLEGY